MFHARRCHAMPSAVIYPGAFPTFPVALRHPPRNPPPRNPPQQPPQPPHRLRPIWIPAPLPASMSIAVFGNSAFIAFSSLRMQENHHIHVTCTIYYYLLLFIIIYLLLLLLLFILIICRLSTLYHYSFLIFIVLYFGYILFYKY